MSTLVDAVACSTCTHRFTTVDLFDQHRRRGHCTDPAAHGLVRIGGVWTEVMILIEAAA